MCFFQSSFKGCRGQSIIFWAVGTTLRSTLICYYAAGIPNIYSASDARSMEQYYKDTSSLWVWWFFLRSLKRCQGQVSPLGSDPTGNPRSSRKSPDMPAWTRAVWRVVPIVYSVDMLYSQIGVSPMQGADVKYCDSGLVSQSIS